MTDKLQEAPTPELEQSTQDGMGTPINSEITETVVKGEGVESSEEKPSSIQTSKINEPSIDVQTNAISGPSIPDNAPKIQHFATSSSNVNSQVNLEHQLQKSKKDLESMVLRYANSERENLQNKKKVEELDKKLKKAIKDNEQLANRIRLLTNDKNQLTDTLNAKVAQLTVLEQKNAHLTNVQGVRLKECEEKLKSLEATNEELSTQIESYKNKEGELLDFSERLSMKHMLLQNELDEALKKVPTYKDLYEAGLKEKEELMKQIDKLVEEIDLLNLNLKHEQECSENIRAQMEKNDLKYKYHVDELQNEVKVIRRKHQIANKELVKEIKQLQLRLETKENINGLQCLKDP